MLTITKQELKTLKKIVESVTSCFCGQISRLLAVLLWLVKRASITRSTERVEGGLRNKHLFPVSLGSLASSMIQSRQACFRDKLARSTD